MKFRFTALLSVLLLLSNAALSSEPAPESLFINGHKYAVRVKKSAFTLEILASPGRVIHTFRIGFGRNPDLGPKLHEGDLRTPEGLYSVKRVHSLADPSGSFSRDYLEKLNKIFLRAEDGHFFRKDPFRSLGYNAYGPRFFLLDYPTPADLKKYQEALKKGLIPAGKDGRPAGPGFGIAIHGNADPDAQGFASGSGCITMNNEDVVRLDPYIRTGTPVLILP